MTPPRKRSAAKPLAEIASAILDPVLRRKAGMTIGLLSAWPDIVGLRLEGVTRPEKLVWPPDEGTGERRFRPATLVVACEGAAALRLQHQTGEVIERVNTFFGYRAVARLKIMQKPVFTAPRDRKPALRALRPDETAAVEGMVRRIEDPKLRAALEAFGRSVLARRP